MRVNKSQLTIAGLIGLFALLAWLAAAQESAAYDEPLHIASSLAQKQLGDYRVDSEDPALFKRWLAILRPPQALPTDSPFWNSIGHDAPAQWAWSVLAIFDQPSQAALANIDRARLAMLLIGVALAALSATWAWQLGGPAAGIISAALISLDPNFIAHAPLAKNDVAAAFGFAATAFALWHVGRRVTAGRVTALALAVAATVAFKFSGVMLAGIVPAVLLLRAMTAAAWPCSGAPLMTRGRRIFCAGAITLVVGAISFAAVWASYGFRYAPSPDPSYTLDVASQSDESSPLRMIDHLHLLPQSYTFGLAYTLSSAVHRNAFLLGRTSETGWWYYFPFAMAVKTPLATMALLLLAIAIVVKKLLHARRTFLKPGDNHKTSSAGESDLRKLIHGVAESIERERGQIHQHFHDRQWAAICLFLPAAIYLFMAMRSNLNIGLRHVLPVYPLAFVAIAVVVAKYRRVATMLLVLLAIESAAAFPSDLAFFNFAAGGSRGGIRLLSDSNLDWGQGLKRLADWQAEHPHEKLYLSYFGTADPGSYGIDYTNAGAGYAFGLPPVMPNAPGVIAVSATHLQGQYVADRLKAFYESLRNSSPREVLGGTIYLYDWPLKK